MAPRNVTMMPCLLNRGENRRQAQQTQDLPFERAVRVKSVCWEQESSLVVEEQLQPKSGGDKSLDDFLANRSTAVDAEMAPPNVAMNRENGPQAQDLPISSALPQSQHLSVQESPLVEEQRQRNSRFRRRKSAQQRHQQTSQ